VQKWVMLQYIVFDHARSGCGKGVPIPAVEVLGPRDILGPTPRKLCKLQVNGKQLTLSGAF